VAEGQGGLTVDGVTQPGNSIPLLDDGVEHAVEVKVG
jgi:hypothetical protein